MKYQSYQKKGLIITYYIDGKEMVYVKSHDTTYTMEEFEKMENERIEKDRAAGYRDRKAHCYDKWYRYNRPDDGAAYDEGVVKCVNETHSKKWHDEDEHFQIIPAMEAMGA